MASSLVFDMDGTLIDSSSGILSALSLSLSEFGYHSIVVNSTQVGPPIASVFRKLLPCVDDIRINQLCLSFQHHYDNSEYLHSRPYAGIVQVLEELTLLGCRLFIATNKRAVPTQKIVDLLDWNHYFEFVYSLDMCDSPDATKGDSLSSLAIDLMTTSPLLQSQCLFSWPNGDMPLVMSFMVFPILLVLHLHLL